MTSATIVTWRPPAPAGFSPGLAAAAPFCSVRATTRPPPFFSSSVSACTYSTFTWSPTFIWSKFFTSGPAVSVTSLPCGPFSVTSRDALSIAVIVAVSLTTSATPPLPGAVPATTAPVCATAVPATATAAARAMGARNLYMVQILFDMV